MFDYWASISVDESPSRTILTLLSWSGSRILNFPEHHRTVSMTWIMNKTSFISIMWQRINQRPILFRERQQLESNHRSWWRSVFSAEASPLSGLPWPSSWSEKLGWCHSKQKQFSHLTSQNLENPFHWTDREDFNSSKKSTISTSLFHNIVSDGKSEQVVTCVLNRIFHTKNESGLENLSNCNSDSTGM